MTRPDRLLSALLLLTGVLVASSAIAAPPTPVIAIRETSVLISGTVPGGSVALFGLITEGKGYYSEQHEISVVLDDPDRDGTIIYEHGQTIATRAIFFAVDLTNGFWAAAAPAGHEYAFVDLPNSALVSRNGKDVAVRRGAAVLQIIHVRPGRGAWMHRSGDGGAADGDRTVDGVITLSADQFRPMRGTEASDGEIRPNDVIILVDPLRREYFARRLGR